MKIFSISLGCIPLAVLIAVPAQAGVEVTASKSLTIQPGGPRAGENGSKYFSIECKDNKQYASFGVLVFDIPKELPNKKVKSLSLTLVQSIPRFAKDGAIRIYLAPDPTDVGDLRFDANAFCSSPPCQHLHISVLLALRQTSAECSVSPSSAAWIGSEP
jgi:hypothetical protein